MISLTRSAKHFGAMLFALWSCIALGATPQVEEEPLVIGHITFVTGRLLRYVPEQEDWVLTVLDAPFGLNDALYSDREGRAEFLIPNGVMIRIAGNTQIQAIKLQPELTEIDVASGMARFFNRSETGVLKVTTPFGYLFAPGKTSFDLYVGEESLEIVPIRGAVYFVLNDDQTRYEVIAGSGSILADRNRVAYGDGTVDAEWDDWNAERDNLWEKRTEVRGESLKYIPPILEAESYQLEENGRWERVRYKEGYRTFWRPAHVESGWQPYTRGRWSIYYGDNCWIPNEPFGYLTHHYGSWVYVDNLWYWAPTLVESGPDVEISVRWYPGRVGWVSSSERIGWFPLLPSEPYYSHRHWGRHSTYIENVHITNIHIDTHEYVHARHGVILPVNNFYDYDNYRDHVSHIDEHRWHGYRVAPSVDRIITNSSGRRSVFTKPTSSKRADRNGMSSSASGTIANVPDWPKEPGPRTLNGISGA